MCPSKSIRHVDFIFREVLSIFDCYFLRHEWWTYIGEEEYVDKDNHWQVWLFPLSGCSVVPDAGCAASPCRKCELPWFWNNRGHIHICINLVFRGRAAREWADCVWWVCQKNCYIASESCWGVCCWTRYDFVCVVDKAVMLLCMLRDLRETNMPLDAKLYKFRLNISNILCTRKTHSHKYLNLLQFCVSCLRFFVTWFRVFDVVIVKPTSFSP